MDFVETKFSATKTENLQFKSYAHSKCIYVGKVPKLKIENLTDFEAFFVAKVPKIIVFNRVCLENSENQI